jgi:phosphatidylglycerophosphate synthase
MTKESVQSVSSWPVVFYVPNILGYLRILLAFSGLRHALRLHPNKALNTWIAAAVLDLIDGIAARKLNQCSRFGTLLDIVADNILRTIVWISSMIVATKIDAISDSTIFLSTAIICLEWTTMLCSQSNQTEHTDGLDNNWKDVTRKSTKTESKKAPPIWVQAVFRNNFRSPSGILAIYGLFMAPFGTYVWYVDQMLPKKSWPSQLFPGKVLLTLLKVAYVGRFLAGMVEMWLCFEYLSGIIAGDNMQKSNGKGL